ncbi:hypothetical protein Purlil1_1369 [Purpureocillium lilacinum]|uniref:Uncharacterized protein n=1 Tax=Purpureocillium lilacinum TaxID=33203 RepID=A0ABR0CDB7_PURLI|nr:hypothetical protein Purlil1_1369 [Purpureocillium lilacinum]
MLRGAGGQKQLQQQQHGAVKLQGATRANKDEAATPGEGRAQKRIDRCNGQCSDMHVVRSRAPVFITGNSQHRRRNGLTHGGLGRRSDFVPPRGSSDAAPGPHRGVGRWGEGRAGSQSFVQLVQVPFRAKQRTTSQGHQHPGHRDMHGIPTIERATFLHSTRAAS